MYCTHTRARTHTHTVAHTQWHSRVHTHPAGQLTRLELLDLSHNSMVSVPESLTRLTRLRELRLAHNKVLPYCYILLLLFTSYSYLVTRVGSPA